MVNTILKDENKDHPVADAGGSDDSRSASNNHPILDPALDDTPRVRKYSRSSSPRYRDKRGFGRIIAASNRLPISVSDDGSIKKSCGGLASAMEGAAQGQDLLWIGWPGKAIDDPELASSVTKTLKEKFNYYPVFMNQQEVDDFYTGFSNRSLWPLLHYMPTYAKFDDKWYDSYVKMNQRYADAIVELADSDDLVWIHDYHLFLVPGIVKERRPELRIGFFLHTPFPSYEIIRCNPHARELMQGLLGSDLIGFHTFGYLRHFRSSVLRLNGAQSELGYIDSEGHRTRIGVYPIGINWKGFEESLKSQAFQEQIQNYQEEFAGKNVVLSVERLDYTKGVPQKLKAIERYLENNPGREQDTKFIIIAVPSRQDVEDYQKLENEVHFEVSRINGRFSSLTEIPINYVHRGVPSDKLAALYARADVCLVTPLVDGMNLVAKEFIACKDFSIPGVTPGVLVLSEFAGAAQELFNAILVNPHDVTGVARAVDEALKTPLKQRQALSEAMRPKVIEFNSTKWASRIISDLAKDLDQDISGLPVPLPMNLAQRFRKSPTRKALFLDYDGTLTGFVNTPSKAVPSQRLLKILDKLSEREDTHVTIISGRDACFLSEHFGNYKNFSLVGEHGYRVRGPGSSWKLLNPHIDLSWIEDVKPILDLYAAMTPGAHVEVKKSSLVWHYRSTDPEFGSWKAAELINELGASVHNMPVKVQHGKKIVEVASVQVNKGIAMSQILEEEFFEEVLVAGDDLTDEEMFANAPQDAVTVKIGRGESKAQYRLPSSQAFLGFLELVADA